MIVVSNTSPLTNLAAIGRFDLLQRLYREVHIAEGVWQELNAGGRQWPAAREVAAAPWIRRHAVQNRLLVTALERDLDHGEAESITLALELRADLILLDEKEGRHAARQFGLRKIGIIGMLLAAKERGLVDLVRPGLDDLRHKAGFYLDDALYRYALGLAGETEPALG